MGNFFSCQTVDDTYIPNELNIKRILVCSNSYNEDILMINISNKKNDSGKQFIMNNIGGYGDFTVYELNCKIPIRYTFYFKTDINPEFKSISQDDVGYNHVYEKCRSRLFVNDESEKPYSIYINNINNAISFFIE